MTCKRMRTGVPLLGFLAVLFVISIAQADDHRFFYEGDGRIQLISEKNQRRFDGAYRTGQGRYDSSAFQRICAVFGAPCQSPSSNLSLRLIAFLDYLEDRFKPAGPITITSGFRNPVYNARLRKSGRLAAKASLHQYGMAVDMVMPGVPSERIWRHVQDLGYGGTGYYHGKTVHVDVGPARSWDETTSGVGTGLADDNKLINLVTDFDRYQSGDVVSLRFTRMTAFPIGLSPKFFLTPAADRGGSVEALAFYPKFTTQATGPCPQLANIEEMAAFVWRLPDHLTPGRYVILASFCDNSWDKMPDQIRSPAFEIVASRP